LGEAAEDDAGGRGAQGDFVGYELFEGCAGAKDAGFVVDGVEFGERGLYGESANAENRMDVRGAGSWAADVFAASYYVVPAGHYEAAVLIISACRCLWEEGS
jgi:hypothetical protein